MPDYDPKSIPILDDIIVEDNSDSEPVDADIADSESQQDDSHMDLFAEQTSEIDSSEITRINISSLDVDVETMEPEVTGPEITDIDRFIETAEDEIKSLVNGSIDVELSESALIDYHAEEITEDLGETESDRQHENLQQEKAALAETVPPFSLEAIAEDVVKHLMPDLEQQLRLLVLQALEEKLPDEIMVRLSPNNDD